ncbi:hypothetical protein OROHE_008174 [Orobanche hederae]
MTSKVIGPNGKLLVEMWPTGDFVGPNAAKFKTAIGDAVRLHTPINIPDLRKVQDCFKDATWTALTEKYEFTVAAHVTRPVVERTYPQKLRTQRGKYRAEYLAKAATIEDARANIPPSINPALWIEFSKKDPTKNYYRVDGWFEGHKRADGTLLESAREVYDKVQEAHKKILESRGTSGDISCDALSQVLGKEKKNRVRGVGSYVTKTQLESACAATASVNLNPSPSTFAKVEKVEAAVARVEADISEMRSYMTKMFELIQGCVIRVTLLDKDEREVSKGSVDHNGIICHGRKIVSGEKRVYIEEVLEPDCLVYDGPQNGNHTLNDWLDGGYIIWLEGRLNLWDLELPRLQDCHWVIMHQIKQFTNKWMFSPKILWNLVYVVGLPLNFADEEQLLQRKEYFSQYGKVVLKVSISRTCLKVLCRIIAFGV